MSSSPASKLCSKFTSVPNTPHVIATRLIQSRVEKLKLGFGLGNMKQELNFH